MDEQQEKLNKEKYNPVYINNSIYKYEDTDKNKIYDDENNIKLKETEEYNIIENKVESKINRKIEKMYFIILIILGIIVVSHIIHYFFSDYVRNLF